MSAFLWVLQEQQWLQSRKNLQWAKNTEYRKSNSELYIIGSLLYKVSQQGNSNECLNHPSDVEMLQPRFLSMILT